MTRSGAYHRYRAAQRCVNCSKPSDYGVRCWNCARRHHGDPHAERARLEARLTTILKELHETATLIERLEKEELSVG